MSNTSGRTRGSNFTSAAKEPVELKMRAKLSKKKFDRLFGRGLRTSLEPGELTLEGSPLWEKIASESTAAQIKQLTRGVINIVRLDANGTQTARVDHLHCKIEGGFNEWRFTTQLPGNLVTIVFSVDLEAMRKHPEGYARMRSTFEYQSHLTRFGGVALEQLDLLDRVVALFGDIRDGDRFRIDVSLEGVGDFAWFTLFEQRSARVDRHVVSGAR